MDLADRVAALEKQVADLIEQVRKLSGDRTEAEVIASAKGKK